jgi:drug/metabolite transporter (DMT)-like permease
MPAASDRSTARADAAPGAATAAAAIGWMALSVLLFSIMDATVKWLETDGYGVAQVMFFRGLFGLPFTALVIARGGGLKLLRTRRPLGHVTRSLIGTTTVACFFYAYAHMALADAVAIGFAAPLFSILLALVVLSERVGRHRLSAVILGFGGVSIMLRPGLGVFEPAALVALAGTASYACATVVIRQLSRTEPASTIVFYYMLTTVAVSAAFLPFDWHAPDLAGWVLLACVGLAGSFAQISFTQALAIGPVARVAPFDYMALLWAILFGYVLWGDLPDWWTLLGAGIVVAAGLYILYRETRKAPISD